MLLFLSQLSYEIRYKGREDEGPIASDGEYPSFRSSRGLQLCGPLPNDRLKENEEKGGSELKQPSQSEYTRSPEGMSTAPVIAGQAAIC